MTHGNRMQVQHGKTVLALGALVARTAITSSLTIDASRSQGVILKQLKGAWHWINKTLLEGPIIVGFSIDLSAAEVAEAINADPQHINDIPATERANRKVFPLFQTDHAGTVGMYPDEGSGDAASYKEVNLPWKQILEGQGLQFFCFNADTTDLTTGMIIEFNWVAVQEWLRD